jgi:hypothetical protein
VWPNDITVQCSRVAEHTETITAELSVVSQAVGEVHWSRLNLLAATARAQLAKACTSAHDIADWQHIIDRSCRALVRHIRAGTPSVPLVAKPPEPEFVADRWLVDHILARRQINVLYGPGDVGKSWLALALALSGLQGYALSSRWTVGPIERVLYLDWESDQDDLERRLWALTAAREPLQAGAISYRKMRRPITDVVDDIETEVAREKIDLVITDSLGAASGVEPESNDAALRTMRALRQIEATHLVLGHTSKASLELDGPRSIFGGYYNTLTARCTVEVRRRDDGDRDALTLDLHPRKNNLGPKMPVSALAFRWSGDQVLVSGVEADLTGAPLPVQIADLLKRRGTESVAAIAECLASSEGTVRSALNRMEKRGNVRRISEASSGRGEKVIWGLVDRKRGNDDA